MSDVLPDSARPALTEPAAEGRATSTRHRVASDTVLDLLEEREGDGSGRTRRPNRRRARGLRRTIGPSARASLVVVGLALSLSSPVHADDGPVPTDDAPASDESTASEDDEQTDDAKPVPKVGPPRRTLTQKVITRAKRADDGDATPEPTKKTKTAAKKKNTKKKNKVPPGETEWGKLAESFVRAHIEKVNRADLEGYLADFIPELVKSAEHRAYSQRVLEVLEPQIEIVVLEVAAVRHKAAHVHVVQRTTYVDEWQRDREDIALIKYNLREIDGAWYIASSSRFRIPELPDVDLF